MAEVVSAVVVVVVVAVVVVVVVVVVVDVEVVVVVVVAIQVPVENSFSKRAIPSVFNGRDHFMTYHHCCLVEPFECSGSG